MKIIKLTEDHYIVMDDSEIKEGDWIGFPNLKKFVPVQYFGGDLTGGEKKITHSTQPLEWFGGEIIFLSEVKELLGIMDVEKKALEISPVELDEDEFDVNETHRVTWIDGYNQALEDNKDKKYTETDIKNAIIRAYSMMGNTIDVGYFNEVIQSIQPKTEWEVEFVDGKLKLKS